MASLNVAYRMKTNHVENIQMNRISPRTAIRRCASSLLTITASCIAMTACGGGSGREQGAGNSASASRPIVDAQSAVGGPTPVTPPPRNPDENQQLRNEIERLEREGVLPNLDRGTDIAGPDVDHNGVRDDIDAYIAALPITDLQKRAAQQRAREQQSELLLDPTDREAVIASSQKSMAAAHCMWIRFNRSDDLSMRIEAITANTPERAKRYLHFMAALNGISVRGPTGDTCEP